MRRWPWIVAVVLLFSTRPAGASLTLSGLTDWVGTGTQQAGFEVDWEDGTSNHALAWGYRWTGTATGQQMLTAVVAADPRLFAELTTATSNGAAVLGFGFEPAYGFAFALTPPLSFDSSGTAYATFATTDDGRTAADPSALWQEGWYTAGYWSYWTTTDSALATTPATAWGYAATGFSSRVLSDGAWDGWAFERGFTTAAPTAAVAVPPLGVVEVPEPATAGLSAVAAAVLLVRRRRRLAVAVAALSLPSSARASYIYNANDFATAVVSATGPTDPRPAYGDPTAVLDQPALTFNDSTNPNVQSIESSSIVNPPYNFGPGTTATRQAVTTVLPNAPTVATLTVKMGRPITHDPAHPYGDDLIVFGNSFYSGSGLASDATNLNTYAVAGVFGHPVQVSVSPDDVNWFTFPTLPVIQPYNAYRWDPVAAALTTEELNPTVPLNPAVYTTDFAGQSAAAVLAAYGNSAGGTALDLLNATDANGLTLYQDRYTSVQYVRFASTAADYAVVAGVSAVSDSTPVPEPAAVASVGVVAAMAVGRRGRRQCRAER